MNEFLEPFLEEARELVEQATADLLALEAAPEAAERLDSAFRAFHTLKGAAGIVEFPAMGRACHAVEDALAAIRAGEAPMTPGLADGALACIDQIVRWLDTMAATREPPADAEAEADAIVARLVAGPAPARPAAPELLPDIARAILRAQVGLLSVATEDGLIGRVASAGRVAANVLRHDGREAEAARIDGALAASHAARSGRPLAAALMAILDPGATSDTPLQDTSPRDSGAREGGPRMLRIPAERIDALVQLTGELTVVKNALGHLADVVRGGGEATDIAATLKERQVLLDRLVRELQQSVLTLRVLPLSFAFQRFPRLVREIAAGLGKPVRLEIAGDETEADKTVVEALSDPLLHVLRNALDHGVEAQADRTARGKAAAATIRLRAVREAENVVVEIEDDGAGVDLAKVRAAAVARGAAAAETVAAMTDEEALDLIFAPGLSTAAEVSALSGRGVGMDAVRTAVARIGGRVSVASRRGHGTTVRFILPFTVMMTALMTVEVGGETFGVPLDIIVETVRLPRGRIVPVGAARAFVSRGRTVPLLHLADLLGTPTGPAATPDAVVVVAVIEGQPTGFEVDRLGSRLDVLLKPMDGLLASTPGVAGTTLTGDGRVLLVLDLPELVR